MEKLSLCIKDILTWFHANNISVDFYGHENTPIHGFSDPQNYLPHTVIWAGKPEDIVMPEEFTNKDVALLMVRNTFSAIDAYPNVAVLADPRNIFMQLVTELCGNPYPESIEQTAIVSPEASLGEKCYVGHYAVIEPGVRIGNRCAICQGVFIGRGTIIGDDCVIAQQTVICGASTGSVYYDTAGQMRNMPNVGGVRIGNNVQIGPGCDIGGGTFFETLIGNDCVLNSGCSVGHNCKIGERTMLLGRCTIHGNVTIGNDCEIVSAIVKNRVSIGQHSKIGIGSVVIGDIESDKVCFGNPARVFSENVGHRD